MSEGRLSSELENVAVTYGRKAEHAVTALDETNLRIGQGDFIALVGPSGCGKSTILKLVGGLIPATQRLRLSWRDARSAPSRCASAWRSRTRRCCPGSTIRDNVMLPLKIVPPFRAASTAPSARRRVPRSRRGAARAGRPEGLRRQVSLAALRRHAAARLALPRADPRSAAAAARRAVRRARSVHPRGAVGDHAGAVDDAPADRAAGHPRPAGGGLSRQPHLRDAARVPAASSTTAWCRSRGRARWT